LAPAIGRLFATQPTNPGRIVRGAMGAFPEYTPVKAPFYTLVRVEFRIIVPLLPVLSVLRAAPAQAWLIKGTIG